MDMVFCINFDPGYGRAGDTASDCSLRGVEDRNPKLLRKLHAFRHPIRPGHPAKQPTASLYKGSLPGPPGAAAREAGVCSVSINHRLRATRMVWMQTGQLEEACRGRDFVQGWERHFLCRYMHAVHPLHVTPELVGNLAQQPPADVRRSALGLDISLLSLLMLTSREILVERIRQPNVSTDVQRDLGARPASLLSKRQNEG
jgi:hypothetical protein